MEKSKNVIADRFTLALFVIYGASFFAVGAFYEWISAALSAVLCVWLILSNMRRKVFSFRLDIETLSLALLVVSYLAVTLWAIDRGAAFIGFIKFLPALLFAICAAQDENTRGRFKRFFPYFTCAAVILSVPLMYIPFVRDYFSVAERMSGFFQYPNTFAVMILCAELVELSSDAKALFKYPTVFILLGGLFLTGSRAVWVIAFAANAALLVHDIIRGEKNQKKIALISIVSVAAATGAAFALGAAGIYPFDRLLAINFDAVTFRGRLEYYKDALPQIATHPFGLGYLGYHYSESTFQASVYTVKYVHNDILQIALDVGWLPVAAFTAAFAHSTFKKGRRFIDRVVLLSIFAHLLFDFDLQFITVFCTIILFWDDTSGKNITVNSKSLAVYAACGVLGAVSAYFAVALAFWSFGANEKTLELYPYNTDAKINLLLQAEEPGRIEKLADEIIADNDYVSISYSAKARVAFSKGDFGDVIKYKREVFKRAPYAFEEYEDYCRMLINGVALYNQSGDEKSARICKSELVWTKNTLAREHGFFLPDEIADYIAGFEDEFEVVEDVK